MPKGDRASRQFVVIGLGRFGLTLAKTLTDWGHDVLGIDQDENRIQEARDLITHAVQVESLDERTISELGLSEADVAVVAIGENIEASILITAMLVEAGTKYVVARASTDLHGVILRKVGAHHVIYPEVQLGVELAHQLRVPGVGEYISMGEDAGIYKLQVPKEWTGKRLSQLYKSIHDPLFSVLVIIRTDEIVTTPGPEEVLAEGDTIAIICRESRLDELQISL